MFSVRLQYYKKVKWWRLISRHWGRSSWCIYWHSQFTVFLPLIMTNNAINGIFNIKSHHYNTKKYIKSANLMLKTPADNRNISLSDFSCTPVHMCIYGTCSYAPVTYMHTLLNWLVADCPFEKNKSGSNTLTYILITKHKGHTCTGRISALL